MLRCHLIVGNVGRARNIARYYWQTLPPDAVLEVVLKGLIVLCFRRAQCSVDYDFDLPVPYIVLENDFHSQDSVSSSTLSRFDS